MPNLLKVKLESMNQTKPLLLDGLAEFPEQGERFILYTKIEQEGFDYLKTSRVQTIISMGPDRFMFTTDNTNYALTILKD